MTILTGCGGLPESGPSTDTVLHDTSDGQGPRYEVVDIDPAAIEVLTRHHADGFSARFGDNRVTSEPVIGIGDTVAVTIWEAAAGGLFSSPAISDKVGAGSNSAQIPEQVVGRDGGISVPYAGRIHVAGRTSRDVQAQVEQALAGKAIQPQVLINVTHAVSNSATVGGEVGGGARIPLSIRGDRLLDVIAAAGGVRAPVNETFVELSRDGRTYRVALMRVIAHPEEDIYVHPNDVITLVRDPQKFIAYGATGNNAEIPFDADGITLAEALAKAGGLADYRSDAEGVFLFRYEPEAIASALKPGTPLAQPGRLTPVVYRLNLKDPNSLFMQQRFRIANRDLIYVSNAPSTEVQKFFGIIGGGVGTLGSIGSVVGAAATIK